MKANHPADQSWKIHKSRGLFDSTGDLRHASKMCLPEIHREESFQLPHQGVCLICSRVLMTQPFTPLNPKISILLRTKSVWLHLGFGLPHATCCPVEHWVFSQLGSPSSCTGCLEGWGFQLVSQESPFSGTQPTH